MYFSERKLAYSGTLSRYLRGECVVPVTWELDLTTRCNHNCPGCCGNRISPMSLDKGEPFRFISQVMDAGGKGLILTGGGDPTLHPEGIFDVLGLMPTLFFTNGELFDENMARTVLPKLVGMRFSLDAYDGETAQRWRGIDSDRWKRVLENVRCACRLKKEMGLGVTIGAGYLTDAERNGGIGKFMSLCATLGVDYAQCRPILWTSRDQTLPNWDFAVFTKNYLRARYDHGKMVTCSQPKYDLMLNNQIERTYDKCHAGRFASTIGADGKLYFCCHTRYMPEFCLGDLKRESIADIFRSDRVERIRDTMSFAKCPLLCRGDSMNRVIHDLIINQPNHLEFL